MPLLVCQDMVGMGGVSAVTRIMPKAPMTKAQVQWPVLLSLGRVVAWGSREASPAFQRSFMALSAPFVRPGGFLSVDLSSEGPVGRRTLQ